MAYPALAFQFTYWRVASGNWSEPNNWTDDEPMYTNSTAYINNGGTAQITQDGELCYNLTLGDASNENGKVEMNSGGLWVIYSGAAYIGHYGTGTFTQTGGTCGNSQIELYLGYYPNSNGTYQLSGTGQLRAFIEFIGRYGTGTFNQTGGTNQCGPLHVGYAAGSNGTYELSDGQLSQPYENGSQYIGNSGTGTFNHTGGTNTNRFLHVGCNSGSNGTYQLSGTGQLSTNGERIGCYGTGTFIQTGGTNTFNGTLSLGGFPGSNGTYELNAGELLAPGETIGQNGTGTFIQTGGTNTSSGILHLGFYAGSSGTYTISAGQLTTDSLYVGYYNGSGVFNISGAAANITVSSLLSFGTNSIFTAVAGSTIHMTGSDFENKSTGPNDLAGLSNLELIFEGGQASIDPFEVASQDDGAVMERDFTLGTLTLGGADIGQVKLVNNYDNQPDWGGGEALYVYNLNIGVGSYLDLNGLNLYYINASIDPTATIVENGGSLIQAELLGDFEPDGDVDLADFAAFALYWGQSGCGACGGVDFTGEGNVDFYDLNKFVGNWLAGK
jgi:hypothetical protein